MPLYVRNVDPINVGRSVHGPSLVGSQEEVANRTMANIIRQLASLGRHANDIFGEFLLSDGSSSNACMHNHISFTIYF